MPRPPADPYAPPPMHHDRSGAFVRIAILAVLIAGVGFGWMYFSSHQQTASLAAPAEQQQLADNAGAQVYQTNPETAPAPEATPQTAAPTPAPAPVRRSAPRSAPADVPSESVPPPTTSTAPPPVDSTVAPSTPTPLPPTDQGE